ncbi:3-phenylpropionate MFS transporter [Zobellella endophytica]|uniref:3-phenylpropionate MFS transporter n=1 Tax=Zobellella endophytica TaxID=2116700 RepID=A0A2P7R7Y6_9GAMM|nr:3-phenylpropionate MFS transporter [Zobellella endophytica]PSJ46331.1 3-phenylpropionate MFS transporter [Zobellella endophytica]
MAPALWLSLFFAIYYFGYGIFLPFWALWLSHVGAEAGFIGLLLGLGMAARCAGNLAVMSRIRAAEQLLPAARWLCLLSLLVFAGFYGWHSSLALLALMVLVNLIYPALMPVSEAIASRLIVQVHLDYGKARLWGSAAFIAANLTVGSLSGSLGPQWVLHTMVLSLALMLAICLLPMNPAPADLRRGRRGDTILQALRRPGVPRFLLVTSLLQGSHAFYYGFSALYWQQQGYSMAVIGYLWGLGVLAEIAVFAMDKKWFGRLRARHLLLAGAACSLLRWGLMGATTELGWLVFAQLLHAGSFCLSHLGAIRFISRELDGEAVIGTQALYAAVSMGMAVALLLVLSGQLYPLLGGQTFWLMGAAVLPALWLSGRNAWPMAQEA